MLLLAGAPPSTLGFARGHRVGRSLLICCALPVAWLAFTLISGQQTIVRLLGTFASNLGSGYTAAGHAGLLPAIANTIVQQSITPGTRVRDYL